MKSNRYLDVLFALSTGCVRQPPLIVAFLSRRKLWWSFLLPSIARGLYTSGILFVGGPGKKHNLVGWDGCHLIPLRSDGMGLISSRVFPFFPVLGRIFGRGEGPFAYFGSEVGEMRGELDQVPMVCSSSFYTSRGLTERY